ncbi:MAG: TIGR00730 family Rossman fold protein [Endomicrobiales bacterium]|nr:TIGR00730 family Rossman fold protein [Endomicrobiales bacterium]
MSSVRSLCVFCGAETGKRPEYSEKTAEFGGLLAKRGIKLVYGGGSIGLMGRVADAAIASGGDVTGVIPACLKNRELAHPEVRDMIVVGTFEERKARMYSISDAFVALPGGSGTLDELFDVLSRTMLGMNDKPVGILNVSGYYDKLVGFLRHVKDEKFAKSIDDRLVIDEDPVKLLESIINRGKRK